MQTRPKTPGSDQILNTLAGEYGIAVKQVLDRSHAEAYGLAAYLLRRAGNLSLRDVADCVGGRRMRGRVLQYNNM